MQHADTAEQIAHPHWRQKLTAAVGAWSGGPLPSSQIARIARVYRLVVPLYGSIGALSLAAVADRDSVIAGAWAYQVAVTCAITALLLKYAGQAHRVMQICFALLVPGFLVRVIRAVALLEGPDANLYSVTAPLVAGALVAHTIFTSEAAQRINRCLVFLATAAAVSSLALRPEIEGLHVLAVLRFGVTAFGMMILTEFLTDVQREHAQLRMEHESLEKLALSDALTGLANRRACEAVLKRETALAERMGGALSVILIDVDEFKAINDKQGHVSGDAALQRVAKVLRENVRACDEPTRWAGDEFMVVLPATPSEGAAVVAERLRQTVAQHGVTISLGVGTLDPGHENVASFIGRVDRALYRAKAGGRNRAAMASHNRKGESLADLELARTVTA